MEVFWYPLWPDDCVTAIRGALVSWYVPHISFLHFLSARNFFCYLLHRIKQLLKLPWPFSRSTFLPGIPLTSDRFLGVPLSRLSRPQVTQVNVARPQALMPTRPLKRLLYVTCQVYWILAFPLSAPCCLVLIAFSPLIFIAMGWLSKCRGFRP